jgi:hypothetical protein
MKMKPDIAVLFITTFAFIACKKENEQSMLKVRMTDAPTVAEEVNIDLKEVQVKLDKDSVNWVTLETNAGVYDLLGLQNGIDSVIATGSFPVNQTVKEIRLIVGENNSIKVDGQVYPLVIPSGAETGLKIKIDKKLRASLENVLIDFDAALSINQEPDGYKLRPVIKLK